MHYISIAVCLYCFLGITSCVTGQHIAGTKSAPCNLPFRRIATNEFSYPDADSCRKAAERFFNNTPDDHSGVSFPGTRLNDSLYMWRGPLDTEVRFVVRSSNEIPQAINYWEIEKSSGDNTSEKLKKKIDDVIKELEKTGASGCKCKVIRQAKETPYREVVNGKKAWRAIVECPKKTSSPAMGTLREEVEVSGIVINPSYP